METKKMFKLMLAAVCCLGSFAMMSCDNDDDDATASGLNLSATKVEMTVGDSTTVTVSNGTSPFTVASSDQTIATAEADTANAGKIIIKGLKIGSATVNIVDNNKLSGKVSVTVKAKSLTLDKTSLSLSVGAKDTVTVAGGTAPYTATSADTSIATATVSDSIVVVEAIKAGSTTIALKDKDGEATGSVKVTVE